MRNWLLIRGSGAVEHALMERGAWGGDISTASTSDHIEEEGKITDTRIFFPGPKKVSKVWMKKVFLFEPITDSNYPKVATADLALTNNRGKMTSNWMTNDKVQWSLQVQNLAFSKFRQYGWGRTP